MTRWNDKRTFPDLGEMPMDGLLALKRARGYFEEYHCGCVSEIVTRKKDLLGYCGQHGDDRRKVYPAPIPRNALIGEER